MISNTGMHRMDYAIMVVYMLAVLAAIKNRNRRQYSEFSIQNQARFKYIYWMLASEACLCYVVNGYERETTESKYTLWRLVTLPLNCG